MEGLYEWIRNITFYLIFMTVVGNLLPNKKYEKYFRLFAGMVLILLVLKPFTAGLRLEDKIAYYFESISFQKEASELTNQLSKMEEKRLLNMVGQYEEAVETDLASMAEGSGFLCRKAEAVIEAEESSENFGRVISVYLLLGPEEGGSGAEDQGTGGMEMKGTEMEGTETEGAEMEGGASEPGQTSPNPVRRIQEVDPVKIELDTSVSSGHTVNQRQEANSKLSGLRRKISDYYDLEEQDIEIQLENG